MASICFQLLISPSTPLLKHPISSIWHLQEVTRESMIWCYLRWVKPSASKVWNLGRRIWIQFVGSSKRTGQEILVASLECASWIFWTNKNGGDCWLHGGLEPPWCFWMFSQKDINVSVGLVFWSLRLGVWWCSCVWFWTYTLVIYTFTGHGGATCIHRSAPDMYNHRGYTRTIYAYWIRLVLLYI